MPAPGEVLWCEFEAPYSTRYHPPEMTKNRRVVVLSPRNRTRIQETLVIVPLSTQPPVQIGAHHYELRTQYPFLHKTAKVWVKGDMVRHVSVRRLRPFLKHNVATARFLSADDLGGARGAVAAGIGIQTRPE